MGGESSRNLKISGLQISVILVSDFKDSNFLTDLETKILSSYDLISILNDVNLLYIICTVLLLVTSSQFGVKSKK